MTGGGLSGGKRQFYSTEIGKILSEAKLTTRTTLSHIFFGSEICNWAENVARRERKVP